MKLILTIILFLILPYTLADAKKPQPRLILTIIPTNPTVNSIVPLGTVIAKAVASWSNGASFTGTIGFVSPYSNDNDFFTLVGNNIVTNNDISMLGGTIQFITLQATQ